MDRKIVHFVSHTHWDKEWYKTYEEFRIKFIKYFREILEVLENDEGFESFMFDGQSSVVDDYLQIYPAERDRLIKLITAEKLIIGPWYTLPDNYLTSGESLSRNLLIGSNMARELGHTQNVCYIPDSFGQSDAMPQIINEMNLKGTILWRGIDSTQTNNAAFRWKGSSGDEVFAVHLPLGYGYSKKIPKDGSHLEYMKEICNLLEKKYVDNIMLHMGGSDHQPIQKMVPKFIADINDKWKENNQNIEMKMSTLDAFFDDIKKHVDHKSLTLLEGELRSVRDQRVHYGDASGRMDLKKLNRNIELKLAKIVEPILSIGSSLFNERYEKEMINYAWKLLFANQAHDSACATCTDEAHLDMYNRFLKADQIANELINYTNKNIFAKVKLNDSFGDPFIIYNTSAENIKFKSEVTIYSKEKNFKILNSNGEEIKFDLLDQSLVNMNFENIDYCNFVSMTSFGDDYMQKNKGESFDKGFIPFYKNVIRISNNVVPNIGFDIMYVKNCDSILLNSNNKKINTDNIFGKYSINNNGTVALKIGDLDFDNLGYFESVGEAGDSYDYSPPEFDKKYTTLNEQPKIKVLKNTEHFCEVLVSYDWMLPSSLIDEDTKRSEELVQNKIIVKYTFFDDQDWFDMEIDFQNKSLEHVCSVNFETATTTKHLAGQQFGTIERDNEQTNDLNWTKTSRSKKISQFPFQEFVSNFDNKSGLGIITLDSSEYKFEANKDIKIILFRSFGYMGKANLINRPGRPSGIYWKTPDSYMVKTNKYKLSVVPFAGRENFQELAEAKNGILNPLRKFEVVRDVFFKKEDDLSVNGRNSLFKIEQQNITVSCLKKCENENAYILRVYNSTLDCIKNLSIKLSADISKAYYSNIAEDTCEEIKINKNEIIVDQINPNKIVSIKFII